MEKSDRYATELSSDDEVTIDNSTTNDKAVIINRGTHVVHTGESIPVKEENETELVNRAGFALP